MEATKPRKTVFTIILIFALLFGYVLTSSFLRTGTCGFGPGAGTSAPGFTLPQRGGGDFSMAAHKGKVVMVNFWATWCGPCRRELPSLMSLYKRYLANDNFTLIAVSCDEKDWEKEVGDLFLSKNIELPVAFDSKMETAKVYGVGKFPETFLIDKTGTIRYKFLGPREWTDREIIEAVDKLLAE